MADMFSPAQRSRIMSRVRGRGNEATELRMMHIFRDFELRGWRRKAAIFGNPDFVFPSARVAVFVDGCFWHGCPIHGIIPATNRAFWASKLTRNKRRDRIVVRKLRSSGWRVVRIWQHQLREPDKVAHQIARVLRRQSSVQGKCSRRLVTRH